MTDIDGFGLSDAIAGLDVSRETLDALKLIVRELSDWRQKVNLIGPREVDHIWRRHIFDSLQLVPHLDLTKHVVDLGSGAGFPGLVIASLMGQPGGHVTMIESVGKKCAFLRDVSEKASLPTTILNGRVERYGHIDADFITARAFAPLPKLLEYASSWLERGAVGVFPKGRKWQEELTQTADYWTFKHEVIPSRSGDGVILIVREARRVA
ncbi:MAG: 16S rRNA (guanine(527)-N(7))-methyltransferase RsmG [Pseudomonadota bacterium]